MTNEELINRFTYHPPQHWQVDVYQKIRATALEFATLINDTTPDSREKSLALTKLDEVVFWANSAVARNSP